MNKKFYSSRLRFMRLDYLLVLVLCFFQAVVRLVNAHNLDQTGTSIAFDKANLALMAVRPGLYQPLLQAGESTGLTSKSTPAPASVKGVGGWYSFSFATEIHHSV